MDLHAFIGTPKPSVPAIHHRYPEFEHLDDPDHIRWRATWARDYATGLPVGIELTPHPVVRKTPCGAWIDPLAYRQAAKPPWEEGAPAHEWALSDKTLWKFVHNGSGSAWAKPTRAAALRSLGIRLIRWSAAVRRDVNRVNAACDVAATLLTTDSWKDAKPHALFWKESSASLHKMPLATADSPLGWALRSLLSNYEGGAMERCDHVEAVLKAYKDATATA